MVLGTSLMKTRLIALTFFCMGCHANDSIISDSAELDRYSLRLSQNTENCILLVSENNKEATYDLKLRPPCHFARNDAKILQTYPYKNQGVTSVALVIGGPITEDQRKKWNLHKDLVCGEQKQAILLTPTNLTTSTGVLEGGISCKNKSIDEKDFYYFAMQFNEKSKN
ncbi:MAG TPA: hypothetical protein VL995_19755 [Cellvibrio sp.]|nr:hypothetical protein [Cellvibrio sp.]